MAGKEEKEKKVQREFNPEDRFKYLGFEIHPGKIGDIFKSDSDKENWIKKVKEKRQKSARVREHNTLEEPRVAAYEKIVLTVTAVVLIASLFFPWFSGYREIEVVAEVAPAVVEEPMVAMADSLMADSSVVMDSALAAEVAETADTSIIAMTEGEVEAEAEAEAVAMEPEKDEAGFSSIMAGVKRKEYRKEHESLTALGAIASLGDFGGHVFSSGFILILTAILMLVYLLFTVGYAGYVLYVLYGMKGDDDTQALNLKKALRMAWYPIIVYTFCIIISVIGANYSFETTDMMVKQVGSSYGTGTYLGLLSYGFYMTLACFVLSGAKGVEI